MLLAVVQLLFMGAVLGAGLIHKVDAPIPWEMLLRCLLGGWVACLPLAALQLGVSTAWSSFAAPLALNVVLPYRTCWWPTRRRMPLTIRGRSRFWR